LLEPERAIPNLTQNDFPPRFLYLVNAYMYDLRIVAVSVLVNRKGPSPMWIYSLRLGRGSKIGGETQPNGQRTNRKVVVGTVEQYSTCPSAAQKAADALRIHVNKETPRSALQPLTCEQLIAHYTEKELAEDNHKRANSTKAAYKCYLDNWSLPRWGSYRLTDVKTVAVEEWLGKLSLAAGTKAKLRNIMSAAFNHAIRHEWLDKNPISLVRQSAQHECIPTVLDAAEISALLTELQHPYRQMVFLAATGLRASELLALKWCDINFESLEICLNRGVIHQVVGDLKKRRRPHGNHYHWTRTWLTRSRMAANVAVQPGARLGFCKSRNARRTALLARESLAPTHSPCGKRMWH